ncbi:glucose-1-phosphate adenylyltransferase [Christensenellaceae bacterium OttesenSCG-928-L17]|nr:glucose-1-phosphate adenylyltransferase [Christensenellaceae bacterium OttesenSCG-928-L17]
MRKKIVAMLLAGGQGSRLGVLTSNMAKPAVPFGGKYRIIDFPLSNCVNSDIDTVGVLTQYQPLELNAYIGNGQHWDLDRNSGGVFVLPPHVKGKGGQWYSGTANAIYQNQMFVDQYDPKYVLILSGDHIYKMDYAQMLQFHIQKNAGCTIAVLQVPIEEAHRFGIMNAEADGRIFSFEEKPKEPTSNLASMGVYIFDWALLKAYMQADAEDPNSENDFGANIIPAMLKENENLYAYAFQGYWKDVGTIKSLWEANMDLLEDPPLLDLYDPGWRIYSRNPIMPPHYIAAGAKVVRSLVTEGSEVYGDVAHSVLFAGARVDEGAIVRDSIIMPGAHICAGAKVYKAIVDERATIGKNTIVGDEPREGVAVDNSLTGDITLVGYDMAIPDNASLPRGMVATKETLGYLYKKGGDVK